jgi:molybdate transport system substrate-binding protein
VKLNFGASGTFFAQIQSGAPLDVFLSADAALPRRLAAEGRSSGPAFDYAIGKLVLWVPNESRIPIQERGARALLDPSVKFVAIGNPALAPYGVAAESALKRAGVYEQLKDRIVRGNDIQQAAQFAFSGNAQAAFLPLALALAPPLREAGRYALVPASDYEPIVQSGVALKGAAAPVLAAEFVQFLLGPEGRAILEKYGYGLPDRPR